VTPLLGAIALAAGVVVLGFPYLSIRETSAANSSGQRNPGAALSDLTDAARLNPLSADPGRLAGTIALQAGNPTEAQRRFRQSISRQRGGWFAWFGAGLAASALGDAAQAQHDLRVAASIEKQQPVIRQALARVNTTRPLTPGEALNLLVLAQ
jgi:Flp pilus assembly protein TadD